MLAPITLNPRQQHVLWATVRQYVTTAEPVGSKALTREYDLKISPATVRHAMGVLEKAGLLFQPHTSAGRVPSDFGYRLYVDNLIHPSQGIAQQVDSQLSGTLNWDGWSLEALLRGAAQILSTLSGYLTLITVPQKRDVTIRHIQLVLLDSTQILMSVVLDSLETQSMVIQLPSQHETDVHQLDALERELKILSNFLTTHLIGHPLMKIAELDWGRLDREFQRYINMLQDAIQMLAERNQALESTQFVVSGLGEVLRQPEFSETQQVQAIVQLLEEEQDQLWSLVFETNLFEANPEDSLNRRVKVLIGSENPLEPMQGCALVSATYGKSQAPLGSVSVLGPTRMMYENAIAAVEAAANYLSDAFNAIL
ncbi:heat-inducible transcriptional repressor HrcA [Oscillatoria sp. CS-180]|uniref:heat-inducible transcriptional repressor HrcA n=1 Tax=Oscillatoria sp. CS-180 TaxID=3021720 RepID=UPI00232B7295|nr:heat-inducible transcriptional repressor HrcA [Oscillatoria sp. CS-180]MDB9528295.1 heat-inducible transcriptional repressor HrcA [Oscillatoria sp. CS-180]